MRYVILLTLAALALSGCATRTLDEDVRALMLFDQATATKGGE